MVSYLQKLGIYWILGIILLLVQNSNILALFSIPTLLVLILVKFFLAGPFLASTPFFLLGLWFWFLYVVYHDTNEIGVNENWWLAPFFLGPIGGTIYYFATKDKRM